ncbi:hypothetical protein [Marinoscillum sp. MHG1-6]|uniref:hypothetical protein n=1 Tax=Marinoscillum sp. MHG1-6 TaxID=2959627 RepID=UPI0021577D8D|nr:hypothetical protein [Marinoscillum sp. MHG1-6]
MSKERSDHLFTLIKSLKKSEKRYFKLRNSPVSGSDHKYLKLFDEMDNMKEFNEEKVLKENEWIRKDQFSNLKANLYKKILQSLKEYTTSTNEDISIRENIDYIQILFDRSLYSQSMQLLQKVKKAVKKSDNQELHLEVLKWEKNLLPYSLGKNNQERVKQIVDESNEVNERISRINLLTNLTVELNAIYIKLGYLRNKEDFLHINEIFVDKLPKYDEAVLSFSEKLIWYDIHFSYYNFIQDFEQAHEFAYKWVNLFPVVPSSSHNFEKYLRGLNHLLNMQERLYLSSDFVQTHRLLRELANHRVVKMNENIQIRLFKYSYAHQFNGYIMTGEFKKAVKLLRKIEKRLEGFIGMLDKHSELVLFYKIASLYLGNDDHRDALKWLNRIINSEDQDIREDVHSFARILNLIVHYELGNNDVIEYYIRSTYRFLLKKHDMHLYQQYILDFIRSLSKDTTTSLLERFIWLRKKMVELSASKYDKRPFVYFDIISWLDSKIENRPVAEVIKQKAHNLIK